MLITGLAVVKNEADIIEAFARNNCQFLDRLIITDNDSSDRTLEILQALAAEGLPLMLKFDSDTNHPQVKIVNKYLKAKRPSPPDWLVLLDADEFIQCESREVFEKALRTVKDGCFGLLRWRNYIPTEQDICSENNPSVRIQHRREKLDCELGFKAVIPKQLFHRPDASIMPGNHYYTSINSPKLQHTFIEAVTLAHFPVRSSDQLKSKAVIGEWALKQRNDRLLNEGSHWKEICQVPLKEDISKVALEKEAAYYCSRDRSKPYKLVKDPMISPDTFALKYTHRDADQFTDNALSYAQNYFNRLDKTAFSNRTTVIGKTAWGLVAYHNNDAVIGRSIENYGEWSALEMELLKHYIKAGDTVIDIGANIGTHTLAFSQLVENQGEVISFEPQRIPFQLLCTNARLNDRNNIRALQVGLGEENTTLSLPIIAGGNIGSAGIKNWSQFQADDDPAEQTENIPIKTLDSFQLSSADLIKIDVEGMELAALRGARKTIEKYQPVLYVENNTQDLSAPLISVLFDMGYRCWWHITPYFNPDNFYKQHKNIFEAVNRPEINMLCCHQSQQKIPGQLPEITDPCSKWQDHYPTKASHTETAS